MARTITLLAGLFLALLAGAAVLQYVNFTLKPEDDIAVKRFSSYRELEEFVKSGQESYGGGYFGSAFGSGGAMMEIAKSGTSAVPMAEDSRGTLGGGGTDDYSKTNVQVEGVDEADVVKNDGRYIYSVVDNNKVVIVDAYPPEGMRIVSETQVNDSVQEIFVNGDRMVVFGSYSSYYPLGTGAEKGVAEPMLVDMGFAMPRYYSQPLSFVMVYDITDRANPVMVRNVSVEGSYYESRMIGDYVYAIVSKPVYYSGPDPIPMPVLYDNGAVTSIAASDIYYFDFPDSSYQFTNVVALNVKDDSAEVNTKTYLMGYSEQTYVSQGNIYMTYTRRMSYIDMYDRIVDEAIIPNVPSGLQAQISGIKSENKSRYEKLSEVGKAIQDYVNTLGPEEGATFMKAIEEKVMAVQQDIARDYEKTVIHKIAISGGSIEYRTAGEAPGYVLNQFSMDEKDGYLRIATTSGSWDWRANTTNNLYVLDSGLSVVGRVEGLAPGERVYSARFIGDRGYMVTFRRTDPLYVIDLSNPTSPSVLGYLKVTGFSDYLHPYDDTHLIGVGQEADENGRVTGFKLSLFDVTDVANPKEISKYTIERKDAWAYSEAMSDHKAFLFSREKGLMVLPIQMSGQGLTEFGFAPDKWGSWQGAYVFNVDLTGGISLRGKITHANESVEKDNAAYYYDWLSQVRRSLYMDDVLYTVSGRMIKANDLNNINSELAKVELPHTEYDYPIYRAL